MGVSVDRINDPGYAIWFICAMMRYSRFGIIVRQPRYHIHMPWIEAQAHFFRSPDPSILEEAMVLRSWLAGEYRRQSFRSDPRVEFPD